MTSSSSVGLTAWLLIGSCQVAVAAQTGVSAAGGTLVRAAMREAVRLGVTDAVPSNSEPTRAERPQARSDWSRVREFWSGGYENEIVLTVYGSVPGRRYVIGGTADDFGLAVLNVTDPAIPGAVKTALAEAAWLHPEYFDPTWQGPDVRITRRVRLSAGGVFMNNRKVIELRRVVERVERGRIAEIRRLHSASGRGAMWGLLAGTALGLAIVLPACGTNWSQETTSCTNLTPSAVFVLPVLGAGIGALYGASASVSTVVYQVP